MSLPVALATHELDVGMVGETVQSRAGQEIIGKRLCPLFKGAIAGQENRAAFVALVDEVIQVPGLSRTKFPGHAVDIGCPKQL